MIPLFIYRNKHPVNLALLGVFVSPFIDHASACRHILHIFKRSAVS